jgi:hypothetical protein
MKLRYIDRETDHEGLGWIEYLRDYCSAFTYTLVIAASYFRVL